MASRSIARRPNGRWRARYRDSGGREHSKHFDRKVDAQRWLDEVTASMVTGQYVDPRAGLMTFREYAEAWRLVQPHRETTRARLQSSLANQAYPTLGGRPLAEIRPSDVQAWVAGMSAGSDGRPGLAPATVHMVHGTVSGIFKAAVRDRRIASNPCESTRLPRRERKQIVPLTVAQVHALAAEMPDRLRTLVTFTAGTGLRQGEAFGLTVDRVDFLRRTIRIDRQLQRGADGWQLRPPKTSASVRTVPLPRTTLEALSVHLTAYPPGVAGFIFTDDLGRPLSKSSFGQSAWHPAARRAGLPAGTTFHDLRHFYASLLIQHGESVKVVQSRLGHASASETLDTYSHLWPDSDDSTRAAIDSVLGAAGGGAAAASS